MRTMKPLALTIQTQRLADFETERRNISYQVIGQTFANFKLYIYMCDFENRKTYSDQVVDGLPNPMAVAIDSKNSKKYVFGFLRKCTVETFRPTSNVIQN